MASPPSHLLFRWEDPKLAEKAGAFFLAELRRHREVQLETASAEVAVPDGASAPAQKAETAADGGDGGWHLGLDNLPEELPAPKFLQLLHFSLAIRSFIDKPIPDTDDGRRAARELMLRWILLAANFFIDRLLFYLLFDSRYHPERKLRASAIQILRIGNNEEEAEGYYMKMRNLFIGAKLCNLLNGPAAPNGDLVNALSVLRTIGGIFFMTLGTIFPLQAISKCHMSFSLFMDNIGVSTSIECVAKLVKHMKAMQRAIEYWDAHGGTVSPNVGEQVLGSRTVELHQLSEKVQSLQESQQSSAKTLANMDRRQRDLFKFIKNGFSGFIKLFQPQKPKPTTREQVQNALLPSDCYACLTRIKEPHRSQVKAVIDYTCKHPIVYGQQRRGVYTLADAVRDTWRANADKWSRVPGTFATVNDLKSACYKQQQGPDDPFCYQA